MNLRLDAGDPELVDLLARVAKDAAARALAEKSTPTVWLDVPKAAEHLCTSRDAIRGLVKRHQIPCHRTPAGRVLFRVDELDAWAAGDVAA